MRSNFILLVCMLSFIHPAICQAGFLQSELPSVNRTGFTELLNWGNASNSQVDKKVNIIFVHGLRGHPLETWTSSLPSTIKSKFSYLQNIRLFRSISSLFSNGQEKRVFWPRDFLAEDIPQARVWTFGYNADVVELFLANNANSVSVHGSNLAIQLEREVDNEASPSVSNTRVSRLINAKQDPIIFVAHSLGGILVKDAVHKSKHCRRRTKFIVFLGTPHRGSNWAKWGESVLNIARVATHDSNGKLLRTLQVNDEVLDNVHKPFVDDVHKHSIHIHSFQEGRGYSGVKGLQGKVVDDFSSKLGLPSQIETVESIDANHMQMARSKHRSDESYRSIAGVLKKFLKSGTFSAESPVKPVTDIPQKATRTATQKAASPCSKDMIYALPLRNRRFVGRTEKLKELEGRLFNNGGYQKLALFGLGGVGKSQVALEFAYRVTESRPDYSIFWVPAVSRESFEQAYEDITTRCSIRRFPTFLPLLGYSKKLFQNHLSTASACKWLLIVDNADDGDIVFGKKGESNGVIDYLPKSENGLTLFTTRNRGMAVDLAGSDIVEIHEMGPVEAETFLRQSLVQKESLQDQRIVSELLEELTFLPLAIAQAAAYINTMQITIAGYLHLFQTSEQDAVSLLSYEFHDETRYKDSQNAVASIFDDSFNRIMKTDCIAERILTIMSCLDHKRIPRFMLSASKAIPQHMQPAPRPEAQMTRAIGLLRACGFMTQPNDNETYDMHRIVHLANKVWVNQKGVTKNGKILVARLLLDLIPRYNDSIDDTFPRYDYNDDAFWREYIPQALHFLEGTKSLEIDPWDNSVGNTKPSDARILDEISLAVGNYLLLNCRFEEAANMLNESYFRQDVLLPKRSHLRLEQAERYIKNGQIAAAIEILFHLRVMQKINLPKDEPYLLMLQHELAMVYARDGQMKAAIRLLEHMVAVQHEDDSGRLISQHQLALVYKEDGQSVRAFDLLKHVITVKTILKERYHRRLASDHDIARSYFAKIEMKQKIHFLEDIISIKTTSREAYIDRLDEEDKIARFYFSRVKRELDHELLHHSLAIEDMVSMGVYPRRLPQGNNTTYSIYIDGHMDRAIDQYNYVVATDWTEEDLFQTPSIPLRLQSFS